MRRRTRCGCGHKCRAGLVLMAVFKLGYPARNQLLPLVESLKCICSARRDLSRDSAFSLSLTVLNLSKRVSWVLSESVPHARAQTATHQWQCSEQSSLDSALVFASCCVAHFDIYVTFIQFHTDRDNGTRTPTRKILSVPSAEARPNPANKRAAAGPARGRLRQNRGEPSGEATETPRHARARDATRSSKDTDNKRDMIHTHYCLRQRGRNRAYRARAQSLNCLGLSSGCFAPGFSGVPWSVSLKRVGTGDERVGSGDERPAASSF